MKPWSLLRAALSAALLALLPCVARAQGDGLKGVIDDAELVETRTEIPRLLAPAAYEMKDGVLDIELSEYAGYAGLVVANGGLEPNDASSFAKKHGFKLRIRLSEEESWSALNSGKIGASATTPDVLAAYGRQFQVVVPAQIGFSRSATPGLPRTWSRSIASWSRSTRRRSRSALSADSIAASLAMPSA